jgi:hypothetical protein
MDRNTMMVAVMGQLTGGMILITLLSLWFRRKRDVPIAANEGLRRIEARLTEMQHALDTVAVEVERISEAQRFTTKLLSERGQSGVLGAEGALAERSAGRR